MLRIPGLVLLVLALVACSDGGDGTAGPTADAGVKETSPQCDYAAVTTCDAPKNLGSVTGDDPNPALVATGQTSEWLEVRATEYHDFSSQSLSVHAKLESPVGMDFDVFLYQKCGTIYNAGNTPDEKTAVWSDTLGTYDNRDVLIEVRYVSGSICGPNDLWRLSVD